MSRDTDESPAPGRSVEFSRRCLACVESGSFSTFFWGTGSVAQPAKKPKQTITTTARQRFLDMHMLSPVSLEGKFEAEMSQNHASPSRAIFPWRIDSVAVETGMARLFSTDSRIFPFLPRPIWLLWSFFMLDILTTKLIPQNS